MKLQEQEHSSYVVQPQTASEAAELYRASSGDAVFVAGGTLLRTQWEAGTAKMPRQMIDLSRLPGIVGITVTSAGLVIGAMTTLATIRANDIVSSRYPLLTEAARLIAAPSIRNLATIGGNVVYGVGDTLPALLVYDALLHWHDGKEETVERLADWLPRMRKDRVLLSIELPYSADRFDSADLNAKPKRWIAFHKVGRREAFIPSLVTVAMEGTIDVPSGKWLEFKLALGGGQTEPARLGEAEDYMRGRITDSAAIPDIYDMVLNGYMPKGDAFASEQYRKTTAANLVAAELWQTVPQTNGEGGDRHDRKSRS